ncbi:MAG: helix-turn-helix transcriptional regulator, partial [Clostridia bacterium]|nr:helix-turn-helix transcriptional regulator [Clostridia bacterium]
MYLKRLKDLREDRDLTQSEVASYLQITRQQYGLYETGK